ncbi:MAG: protein kinase [Phycisphaera sp.]|nr:protein kinase [Phycisphaera sp.]
MEVPGRDKEADKPLPTVSMTADDEKLAEPAKTQRYVHLNFREGDELGKFRILRLLGRGGMGAVYEALDTKLQREVALKIPPPDVIDDEEARERFVREARLAARLHHPNAVTVFDVYDEGDVIFIAMELVRGHNAGALIKQSGRLPVDEAVRLITDACRALSTAHKAGLIHRDIKPGNILIADDGAVKMADFGLAKDTRPDNVTLTVTDAVLGTPKYMSPEQCRSQVVDARSDLYSLGATFYTLLTGKAPYDRSSPLQYLYAHCNDPVPDPRVLRPELPERCARIVYKAMAKAPADRYQTADTMLADLQAWDSIDVDHSTADLSMDDLVSVSMAPLDTKFDVEKIASSSRGLSSSSGDSQRSRPAERRRVTVLQCDCDVYESEAFIESLDADDQMEILDRFQELAESVIAEFDGTVVRRTDQGLLACFGFPVALEDAASVAVRTGLAILERLEPVNEHTRRLADADLGTRVVIHSDTAIVEDKGDAGDLISLRGQVRNVIRQFDRLVEYENTVVVTGTVHQIVQGYFDCESLGMHRVRGITDKIELLRVVRKRSARTRVEVGDPTELTPLVGRDREVGLLEDRWEQAVDGMGQVVLLIGEAGLGKSRLVHMLKQKVDIDASDSRIPVIEWRCSPHHQNSSLYPVIECFERLLGFEEHASHAVRLKRLEEHLRFLGLDDPTDVALFASLLSISHDSVPAIEISGQQRKDRTLELVHEWIRCCADIEPVLFIVEDLHWVDPTTLEFLTVLVNEGFHDRILTLLTFRPEFETPWSSKAHQTQIALNRLTRKQVAEMVAQKADVPHVSDHIVKQIVTRTDGVPLFVEEFTLMLLEAGPIRNDDDSDSSRSTSGSLFTREIPATLQDMLMARLDRIAGDITLVQLASVIGREFSFELISTVADRPEDQLTLDMDKLVESGLLNQRRRGPKAVYQFKHALIEDAAYSSLIKKDRQKHHHKIAKALEERFEHVRDTRPELLAHHFDEAGDYGQAAAYWERAGKRSADRCSYVEAIDQYTHALNAAAELPESDERHRQEIGLLISIGVPLQAVRGYSAPEVQASYERAHALCRQLETTTELFPVLYGLFRYYMLQARYKKALELGDELLELAAVSKNVDFDVASNRAKGSPLVYCGRHREAVAYLKRVLKVDATPALRSASYRYDVVDPWTTARSYMAWSLWLQGHPDQAMAYCHDAIASSEKLDHPFSLTLAVSFAQWLHQFRRDVDRTRETVDRATAIFTEHNFAFWIGWAQVLRGWTMSERGEATAAMGEIREGIVRWRAQGSELGCHYYYALLAEVCAKADKLHEGFTALDDAKRFALSTGEAYYLSEVARLRGELTLRQNPDATREARSMFDQAIDIARNQGARSLELRAAMSLARLTARDDPAAAASIVKQVYDQFTEGFDTTDLVEAKSLIDSWK